MRGALITLGLLALAACNTPDEDIIAAYGGIGEGEIVSLGGAEPFWGAKIAGDTLTFSTPENSQGSTARIERIAGNGGLSFSGTLDGRAFTAMVTPGDCSDGMSDRTYPFTATVQLDGAVLRGCGHTDKQGFTEEEAQ